MSDEINPKKVGVTKAPIPTINVLPPMTPFVRDLMYGVLAWAATIVTVTTIVCASVPAWSVPDWLLAVNTGVNALWALGGFVAKDNVPV